MDNTIEKQKSKRPNVLAISYLFPNSQQPNHGIFVYNRLKALSELVNVRVINPIPYFPGQQFLSRYESMRSVPEFEEINGISVYHPRYFSIPGYLKGIEAGTYRHAVQHVLNNQLKDYDFDIIDLHWTYPDLPTGVALKKATGKPMICTLRGMEAFHIGQGIAREKYIQEGLKQADKLIALSQELKDTADNITGQPEKSHVVINGVDTDAFYYIDQVVARQHIKLPCDTNSKIILGVGSLIYRKGFDRVIDALPAIKEKIPNVKYIILGSEGPEGDYRAQLKAKVAEKGLQDSVIFYGGVPNADLVYWYNAADVFCLSSRGEGSPNVLSEALACGCPVVSTDVGSAKDILANAGKIECVISTVNDYFPFSGKISNYLSEANRSDCRQEIAKRQSLCDWNWCADYVFSLYNIKLK